LSANWYNPQYNPAPQHFYCQTQVLIKQADDNLHGTYIQLLPNKFLGANSSTRTIIVPAAPLVDEIDLLRLPLGRPDIQVH